MGKRVVAAAVAILAVVVASCSSDAKRDEAQAPPPPLPDPPFVSSSGGSLTTTLTAQPGSVSFNGTTYSTNLYNGLYIPPVWRVQPGDTINLTLTNAMSTASAAPSAHASSAHGAAGGQSFTNLHYHGFNVSPNAPADDVFLQVFPQGSGGTPTSYQYRVPIPTTHPQGLFWFHPHPHGISEPQVLGGMSGGAIVGDILGTYYPTMAGSRERVMLLKDFQASSNPGDPLLKTINGLPLSSISIAPGEVQFWRFANIGADAFFDMQLQDLSGNPVPMYVIAVDGNPTDSVLARQSLFLGAGARMEAFVVGPPQGSYVLKSLKIDTGPQGDPNPEVTLAQVTSSGQPPTAMTTQQVEALRPAATDPGLAEMRKRAAAPGLVRQRPIVFSESADGNTFFINGKTYDPDRIDTTVPFGTVEQWNISNTSGELHVFHIHQLDFLVQSINGITQPATGLQDTITIPVGGTVKALVPFTQSTVPGKFVYHCHILGHEDNGMMANIVVQR